MVEMDKAEFKSRLKEIGYSYGKFCAEHGIERRTVYDWKVVPKWAEYWIRMVIAEKELASDRDLAREEVLHLFSKLSKAEGGLLDRIRAILDD